MNTLKMLKHYLQSLTNAIVVIRKIALTIIDCDDIETAKTCARDIITITETIIEN